MAEMRPGNWTEELLVRAAGTLEYPPTPDIVASVRARLASVERGRPLGLAPRSMPGWSTAAAAGVLVFVLAAVVALSVSADARDAVADFLGLRVEGEEISIIPTPRPGVTPTPPPPTRDIASYATPVPMPGIEQMVGFPPALPADYGEPDTTYVVDYQGAKAVVLHYDQFDLWELRFEGGVVGKGLPFFSKETRVLEELTVNEQPAYWIAGGGHIVRFIGPNGTVVAGSERTVDRNTLIWHSASGTNYRLETDLPKERALALAETLP